VLAWTIQMDDPGGHRLFFREGHSLENAPARALAPVLVQPGDEAPLLALVRRIQEGDLTAFDRLYQLTRLDAARTLHHLVGNRTDVEDLLQETYLRLLSAVKGFRGESRFRTFLYRVCANVALSHLRWKRRRPEESMAELPESTAQGPDPERTAERRQAARLVELALERLKPKKRIVFVYYELCGMSPDEIAEAVGSSVNTVRSRLHHARLEFTEAMHRLLDTPRAGVPHGSP
jgi:RNA polymerase sigma-70 factor, ECF subfamily